VRALVGGKGRAGCPESGVPADLGGEEGCLLGFNCINFGCDAIQKLNVSLFYEPASEDGTEIDVGAVVDMVLDDRPEGGCYHFGPEIASDNRKCSVPT